MLRVSFEYNYYDSSGGSVIQRHWDRLKQLQIICNKIKRLLLRVWDIQSDHSARCAYALLHRIGTKIIVRELLQSNYNAYSAPIIVEKRNVTLSEMCVTSDIINRIELHVILLSFYARPFPSEDCNVRCIDLK